MAIQSNQTIRWAIRASLISSSTFAASLATHPSVAQAQTAPAAASDQEAPQITEVVVTGSRIAGPPLESVSPITAVTAQEIKDSGVTRVEDLLNSLPQVLADQGSGLSMGTTGIAAVNLRGLGPNRTLVMVNGRRLMGGDPAAGAPSSTQLSYGSVADLNQIPVALVERVDVLTGGASSTYGADAVAGVVNFIMNDHFEGVRIDANVGIYNHNNHNEWINPLLAKANFPTVTGTNWDGANKDLTLIMGHNFADGAGNFEGYLGYRRASPITADHRDHAACVLQNFSTTSFVPYHCGGSSNSAPAVIFGNKAPALQVCDPAHGCTGTTGDLVHKYALFNFAASHYLQRIDERYTAGFFGHLKFNDHVEAYTEFMFMDDETRGNFAPAGMFLASGFAQTGGVRNGNWYVNCGVGGYGNSGMNPYLTQLEFNTLCTPGSKYNLGTGPEPGDIQLLMARRNIEGGPREDNYTHTSWRGVFGARGQLTPDWSYDASFTYGKVRMTDWHNNDTSATRMQDALLAVPGPGGVPVCRSGKNGCVPWNIWDPTTPITAQQLAYFSVPGLLQAVGEEDVFTAFVSGDLTQAGVKLPSARDGLKVVLGTEYRRTTDVLRPDEEFLSADLAGISSPTLGFDGGFHVWEGFTEVKLPLANDLPGVKSLDLEAGYRYSAYTSGFDTNTYKIGLTWSPINDVRLRGSFNRAVRVPNVAELFKPPYVALDSGGDLCNSTTYTPAQCALTNYGNPITVPTLGSPAGQYNGLIGGNTSLKPEVGNTSNIGLVLTPSFLPGFSATIDWTDIKLDSAITSYGPNLIQANCILSGNASSSWCQMVHRDSLGTLWASPQGYTIDPLLNLDRLENESIDVALAYRFDLGHGGRLRWRLDGTYLVKLLTTPGGGVATFDCAGKFGPSCVPITPKWRHRLALDWDTPVTGLSTGLTWRYFGPGSNTLIDPKTPDYVGQAVIAVNGPPSDAHIPSIGYLDLRASYAWDKVTLQLGVNNALDKDPPNIAIQSTGGNSNFAESNTFPSVYDVAGRFLFARLTVDF
jgi:iron complex outermembrane recepter protein